MEYTILVVEDEKGIRETLKIFLESRGYLVLEASNGQEGLEVIKKNKVHLVIVDIMMPILSGTEMVKKLRETSDIPTIFLTAKMEDVDKINAFNLGADDYVTKPFKPIELLARVNAHLRRYQQILDLKNNKQEEMDSNVIHVHDLQLNLYKREVTVNGKTTILTKKEFDILHLLMLYPGRIFSADEIYERVWEEKAINTETVMVHIRKLREKIELNPKKPDYIKVVWGIGYKIEDK